MLGGLNHGLFFGLLYLAAFRLPSGLASTLTALSPLVVMGMAHLVIGERQPRVTVVAAVVGVAGVVTLVWQNDRAGTVDAVGVAAAVGAVVSSALGFTLVKRWSPPDDVLVTTSWQLVAGGLLLLPGRGGGRGRDRRPSTGPRSPPCSTSAWSGRRSATCCGSAG